MSLCDICSEVKDCFFCNTKGTIFKPMCSKGGINQKCYWCMGTGHMKHGRKLKL